MSGGKILSDVAPGYDAVVVGAGPAGMSAAIELSALGLSSLVVDEQASPGGQIYRNISRSPIPDHTVLGADYWQGRDLVARFEACAADYLPSSLVWQIEPGETGHQLYVSSRGMSRRIVASFVVLATGAIERPVPVAGWTTPGVMGVGAAQGLLKSSGALPQGRTVLLGAGPLLWLYAAQMTEAGCPPAHILSTADALPPFLPGAFIDFLRSAYAAKGAKLLLKARRASKIGRARQPRIVAEGDHLAVHYRTSGGAERTVPADTVLVHQGVVPNMNLALASDCEIVWDATSACWQPATDRWGASSVRTIAIAGDAAGIRGAKAAALLGRTAALNAAAVLDRLSFAKRDELATQCLALLQRDRRSRRFIDAMYAPSAAMRRGDADAVICRCEEVMGAELRAAIQTTQAQGANQLKAYTRCGMGPCQGRYCGLTVNEIIADELGVSAGEIMPMRLRPPIKPISLGELAALANVS